MHMCVCAPTRGRVPGCQSACLPVCMFMHTHMHLVWIQSFLRTHTCQAPRCMCVGTSEC